MSDYEIPKPEPKFKGADGVESDVPVVPAPVAASVEETVVNEKPSTPPPAAPKKEPVEDDDEGEF